VSDPPHRHGGVGLRATWRRSECGTRWRGLFDRVPGRPLAQRGRRPPMLRPGEQPTKVAWTRPPGRDCSAWRPARCETCA